MTGVAIVHDYLTQRGGAERVVLEMAATFPAAPVYTSLYDPDGTFPDFADLDIRPGFLNRFATLRHNHRWALPGLAPAFSRTRVDADVVVCSSSGWAHGVKTSGRKVVYCYTPARWLYQPDRYLGETGGLQRIALGLLAPVLRRWDVAAARTADTYLAVSTAVQERIRRQYGRDAAVLFPPVSVDVDGPESPPPGVEPGFSLCVSRLLPYKNVAAVVEAAAAAPERRLVVVGDGPMREDLRRTAPANVAVLGRVTDDEIRWLYRHASMIVTASYEDFGLVPIEAAAFGKPAVALRWGGHLDTVEQGRTGLFFSRPEPRDIAAAVAAAARMEWSPGVLRSHAARFAPSRFRRRLQDVVAGREVRV